MEFEFTIDRTGEPVPPEEIKIAPKTLTLSPYTAPTYLNPRNSARPTWFDALTTQGNSTINNEHMSLVTDPTIGTTASISAVATMPTFVAAATTTTAAAAATQGTPWYEVSDTSRLTKNQRNKRNKALRARHARTAFMERTGRVPDSDTVTESPDSDDTDYDSDEPYRELRIQRRVEQEERRANRIKQYKSSHPDA
jgi:hypothetical protein